MKNLNFSVRSIFEEEGPILKLLTAFEFDSII